MEEIRKETVSKSSRRDIIKKAGIAAAFVVPIITTFNISEVQCKVSGVPKPPNTSKPPKPPKW